MAKRTKRGAKPTLDTRKSYGRKATPAKDIRNALGQLGGRLVPTSKDTRDFQVLQRGLLRLLKKEPPTVPQARELAAERRRLVREQYEAGANKPRTKRLRKLLNKWNVGNIRKAGKLATAAANDKADQSFAARFERARRKYGGTASLYFIPDNPKGRILHWDSDREATKFANLPHYKAAIQEEEKLGRFVLAETNDKGDIMRFKNGNPKIVTVITKGSDNGKPNGGTKKSKRGKKLPSKNSRGKRHAARNHKVRAGKPRSKRG